MHSEPILIFVARQTFSGFSLVVPWTSDISVAGTADLVVGQNVAK